MCNLIVDSNECMPSAGAGDFVCPYSGAFLYAAFTLNTIRPRLVSWSSSWTNRRVGAHAHVRDASCFQEPILAFFSAFGLSHWTIYYLSFFSMLTLSNFSVCPNFLLFI